MAEGDPDMTIGEALKLFERAEAMGIDLLKRDANFAGSFERVGAGSTIE